MTLKVLALRCIHSVVRLDQFWKGRLNNHAARNDSLALSALQKNSIMRPGETRPKRGLTLYGLGGSLWLMKTWHAPLVDFFRRSLPSDSFIRPYAKRLVEDARSLFNTTHDW